MALYGKELAESIRRSIQRIHETQERRNERIANWETDEDDCFMSIRVEEHALSEYYKQLRILETDGMDDFEVVVDQFGHVVRTHWFTNKWGKPTIVGNGVFASSKEALLKKTGWHLETRRYPIWTRFESNGGGLYGVYTGSYQYCRWHTNMVTGEYVGYDD